MTSLGSSSIDFLALSQAPPALAMNTARSWPLRMMPARNPPRASTWRTRPTMSGRKTEIRARGTSSFWAAAVEIPTTRA